MSTRSGTKVSGDQEVSTNPRTGAKSTVAGSSKVSSTDISGSGYVKDRLLQPRNATLKAKGAMKHR